MCGSKAGCCPSAQLIKEEICGNFNGVLIDEQVWGAPGGYISGTFQIFNSASSQGAVTAAGTAAPAIALSAEPGNTISQSVNNPIDFTITTTEAGGNGTYCITLYKRVLA
ncbi:S-Ena type endospore appendage [Metabacillus sp. 84]|uniref:S-Ena type endospore appendage n=1 Tax=unclassified Metabacillus TaxID=2675274 RepID=UPI003CF46874